jgi:hypothetical protein
VAAQSMQVDGTEAATERLLRVDEEQRGSDGARPVQWAGHELGSRLGATGRPGRRRCLV